MAISTASTLLKYASTIQYQVETATVVGTISAAGVGNATVIITAKTLIGTPLTISVPVANNDTASTVAGKIRTVLSANSAINTKFTVGGTGVSVRLTKIACDETDTTLNISINNGTCSGLTAAPTSANTTAGSTFTKLVDIVSHPDMGSSPSKLDTTTQTETKVKTSILGLQDAPDLTFEANYTKTSFNAIELIEDDYLAFKLDFGNSNGGFLWEGRLSVFVVGGGVDEVRKTTITSSAETEIRQSA